VEPARFTVMGYGEDQPIATNETAEGKAQNRRVEVAIMANDDLKAAARRQTGETQ
jgi:outer membrane protein OmpA-like peptidoglycan-associated protein